MAGRNARGMGNIRKKTKVDKKTGKKYEWWEARYTAGRDPGTGKQVQRPSPARRSGKYRRSWRRW